MFTRAADVALVLLVVVPFGNPIHTWPIPSFYSEWLAAMLALIAVAATLCGCIAQRRPLAIPGIIALPLLLAFAAIVQAAFGHVAHPRHALLFASALILAGAMMVIGQTAARTGRFDILAPWLARFLVAGALLQCAVLLLQRAGIAVPWLVFLPAPGAAPTGSLGQANHLADYLWMGVASALYLMVRAGRVSVPGSLLVLILAMISALPASRSVLLYPLGLALAAMLMWRTNRHAVLWRHLAILCVATLPFMLLAAQLDKTASSSASASRTLAERLAATGGERVRAGMYQVALEAAMTRPIVGHGLGAAPWVTFQRADSWPEGGSPVVAEHVHNIVLQWLIEFGIPLTVLALALLLHWLWRVLPGAGSPDRWWGLALLMVIAVHSQLEYPLWLTYFLFPAAWLVGALSAEGMSMPYVRRQLAVMAIAVILGFAALSGLCQDYRELERIEAAKNDLRQLPHAFAAAFELDRNSLLAPNALLFLVSGMEATRDEIDARWSLCVRAMKVSPHPSIVAACIPVARLAGHENDAKRLALLLGRVSPRQ